MRVRPMEKSAQGMTLTRFGLPSQTSARSSMMTTMLVSHGKSRCKLLRVMPANICCQHGNRCDRGQQNNALPLSSRLKMRPPKSPPSGSMTLQTSIA